MNRVGFYSCWFAALFMLLSAAANASYDVSVTGFQGKATNSKSPDGVQTEVRLATRGTAANDAKKSWLQFDLSSLYAEDSSIQGHLVSAKLALYGANTETGAKSYVVNGLNDVAALEDWLAASLTWNNAPGNDIASAGALDPAKTINLYTTSVPVPCLNVISETPEANRAALTSFLNEDTDGKVTFILTAGSTTYLKNVDDPNEPILTLTYLLGYNLQKAHDPVPADSSEVETTLSSLSWTNPAPRLPGGVLTCDVYLGTEPNRPAMDKKTLGAGVTSVAINTANFPNFAPLVNQQEYHWFVDVHDTSDPNVIMGQPWRFLVNNNETPTVNAGPDQVSWLGKSGTAGQEVIQLDGNTFDDGLPNPPAAYTRQWTQVSGPVTVTISPDNVDDTTVTITATGVYVFQLRADDTNKQVVDTVQVVVGTDSCHASNLNGAAYNSNDYNEDCIVNLADFAGFAADWAICTNTFEGCL